MSIQFLHMDTQAIETTESFFFSKWLNARMKSGHESNFDYDPILNENRNEEWKEFNWKKIKENEMNYDEDVNQYLILTLAELVNPKCLEFWNQYLVSLNRDVNEIAFKIEENAKQYFVYKINADFLLLSLGLFPLDAHISADAYFEKGEDYYFSAANRLKQHTKGRTALSDVLEKLSRKFGQYVSIMRCMKNQDENYLSFYKKIPPFEISELEKTLTDEFKKYKDSQSD